MFQFSQAFRDEFGANWRVLAIAVTALFFGFSAPAYALPFIYPEVIDDFGWTREQATSLATAKYLTGVIACLIFGRFLDIAGAWKALMASILVGGIALLGFTFVDGLAIYYAVGVLLGIAGPGAMVSCFVLVGRTFRASQGTATGMVLLGTAIGGVVMPIVTVELIEAFGWRGGMAALSAGIWLVAIPALLYGMARVPIAEQAAAASDASESAGVREYFGKMMRGANFWLMSTAFFLVTIVDQALTQHQVLMLLDAGLSKEDGAWTVSAIGFVAIFGRVLAGNILDSKSNRGLAGLYFLLTTCAILSFALANPIVLLCYIVVRAMGHSSVMVDGPVISRHTYGTQHLGLLTGLLTAMANLGSAAGPWVMGRMYDAGQSYQPALILFVILPTISALCIWFVNPRAWKAQRADAQRRPDQPAEGSPAVG